MYSFRPEVVYTAFFRRNVKNVKTSVLGVLASVLVPVTSLAYRGKKILLFVQGVYCDDSTMLGHSQGCGEVWCRVPTSKQNVKCVIHTSQKTGSKATVSVGKNLTNRYNRGLL